MNLPSRFPIDQWHYYSVTGEKPREIAARLLQQRDQGAFVETLLDREQGCSELRPEDRRFLQELVYGATRWQLTLDWLIAQRTNGKPQKPLVQNLLRLALYQMFWLERVPAYAAVNESVEICKKAGLVSQARFINAVLRACGREAEAIRRTLAEFRGTNLALGFSHPEWLCRRWEERWGRQGAIELLEWNNSPPPTWARLNSLRTNAVELKRIWEEEGVRFEEASFPWTGPVTVFRLEAHPPLADMKSFGQGLFYIQDPSTLLAASVLQPKRGEKILDMCAAPGGKSTCIAQGIGNEGTVVAEDIDGSRLKMVEENARRLGAACVRIGGAAAGEVYDAILLDAPCSNTGVMRRRVELRWRIRPEEIRRLAAAQLGLLRTAAKRLRTGGRIVYSTCSLEREENHAVVQEFLAAEPAFRLEEEQEVTPMKDKVDGAYCARLVLS